MILECFELTGAGFVLLENSPYPQLPVALNRPEPIDDEWPAVLSELPMIDPVTDMVNICNESRDGYFRKRPPRCDMVYGLWGPTFGLKNDEQLPPRINLSYRLGMLACRAKVKICPLPLSLLERPPS